MSCSITLLALYAWGGLRLIYAHVADILWASALAALLAFATTALAGPNRKKGRHKNQCLHRLACWLTILLVLGMKPRLLDGV